MSLTRTDETGRIWRLCEYFGGPRDGEREWRWEPSRAEVLVAARDGLPKVYRYALAGDGFVFLGEAR